MTDQLKATQDAKADMESDRPMDRLVCGDVGFGKTEVAIRAAFKAVTDNKQVAVLVPTTVLAYQHFQTFSERLKDFPCKVDYLSRARSTKDVSRIVKELADGKINILIGTHKIIGKSVKFKDLGLLIIDEEQKFGVSVKEKLRQMKVNVDTLTMTATPIPRTLQFSLMGARDLSVIQTPPPNRYPIQTEVHTFNEDIITEAINFEMSRNGQVFFVNNRIQNLVELEAMIKRNIPDCRVCIGHGQMEPEKLEKIIFDFVNYDYDVLLATTIIESGIDIPNANTIIINQAQNFGLSDLHQMRGRVGRSNKKAFCYLLAPPLTSLTPEAKRRLQAKAVLPGVVRHPLPERVVGGVLAVDGGVHQNLPVVVAVPLLGQLPLHHTVVVGGGIKGVGELHAAAAQVGADAGGRHLLGHRVSVAIHVRDGGDAGSDHLRQAQVGTGPDGPVVPAGLHREDIVVQPVLEVVAVAVAPHGGHGHMAVGVDKAGHEHVALAVDLLLKGRGRTWHRYQS